MGDKMAILKFGGMCQRPPLLMQLPLPQRPPLLMQLPLRHLICQPMPVPLPLCRFGQLTLSLSLYVPRVHGQGKACGRLWGPLVRCVPAGWLYDIPRDLRQRAA